MSRRRRKGKATEALRQGVLGRMLKLIRAGWANDAIILNVESVFPDADPAALKQTLRDARKAAGAADKQSALATGERLRLSQIPLIQPR